MLYYAVSGHVLKLRIHYKNYPVIQAIKYISYCCFATASREPAHNVIKSVETHGLKVKVTPWDTWTVAEGRRKYSTNWFAVWRRVVSTTLPAALTPGKIECWMDFGAGLDRCGRSLSTHRVDHPVCSELPYRMSCRDRHTLVITSWNCLLNHPDIVRRCERRNANVNQKYVEIKFQLDATEVFIADLIACSTCFGHHYAHHQELKSIIQWLLPVVFRAVKM